MRKTIRKCVENCGHDNLKLSSVFARVFLFEKHSLQFADNESIYSVGKEFGKATQLFAKQKVLWVLCRLALLVKHSRT